MTHVVTLVSNPTRHNSIQLSVKENNINSVQLSVKEKLTI